MKKLFYTSLNEWMDDSSRASGRLYANLLDLPGGDEAFDIIYGENYFDSPDYIDKVDEVEIDYSFENYTGDYYTPGGSTSSLTVRLVDTGEDITDMFDEDLIWEFIDRREHIF